MEEFLKIDWHPSLNDLIDDVFINEQRMKSESAMYRILRGVFKDPFTDFESDDDEEEEEKEEGKEEEVEEEEEEDEEEEDEDEELENDKSTINDHNINAKVKNQRLEIKGNNIPIQQKNRWIPSVGLSPPFRFPRASILTKNQHAICLRVLLRFSGSEKPEMNQTNRNEIEMYMKLLPTINKEQEEFLNLAKTNWKGFNMKLVGREYINARWKYKVRNVFKLPKYYTAGVNVPFNGETKISVEFETTVLDTGQLPKVIMPLEHVRNMVQCNINKLYRLYPVHNKICDDPSDESTLVKVPVSEDPNCEQLAKSNEVDLVISSGGLNCLATNLASNYNSSWILPIVVKENGKRNIIYIDKPLPPISMTAMQKNAWIYKYLLKSQLLYPERSFSMRSPRYEVREEADDNIFENSYTDELIRLEEENEKFPSYTAKNKLKQSQPSENVSTTKEDSMYNDTENEDNLTELEPKEISDLPVTEKLSKPSGTDNASSTEENNVTEKVSIGFYCVQDAAQNSNMEEITSNETNDASSRFDSREYRTACSTPKVNTDDVKDEVSVKLFSPEAAVPSMNTKVYTSDEQDKKAKDVPQISGSQNSAEAKIPPTCFPARNNFTYRIFSLVPAADITNDISKCKVDRYRILVRSRIDGIEADHPIMVLPKLEHQIQIGAEAVTAEEAMKQWMTLTYRPDTSLARVRISAENSEIIQVERRTAISVDNEIKRLYKLNAENSLITLHNIINDLKTLKPGKYLLRHTPSNGAFATIYHEADNTGKNAFDLHATYSVNHFQTIPKSPWPAIDPSVVTPALAFYERMPAMYFPPRTDPTGSFKNARGRGRGRGRGKAGGRGGGARGRGRGSNLPSTGEKIRDEKTVLTGVKRIRTKKAKKNKNKKSKVESAEIQQL